jgi:hypothetical protein
MQATNSGTCNTIIQYADASVGGTAPATNYFAYYHANSSSTYGVSTSNSTRSATNYYFLRNDDSVAQCQLGSLRSYTNYNYVTPTTSGALTISKTDSQVQQVNLTGNITTVTFTNFVTSASDSVNTDEQQDTVRIIFNQGTTGGYGITMPTGNTQIKYASGNSTIATTANSVTTVDVQAIRISNTATYLVNISSAYS